ncbi:restriction endonuclease [Streptomyces sp. NPDC087440]|uniref:restriction endonuclease n=1 Tax=Streptomyces sp. NPDC087440 TaxID=3365790 RepID=UPI00380E1D9E
MTLTQGEAPGSYSVLHDPDGELVSRIPLDRAPHERLARRVLDWPRPHHGLRPDDYAQIAYRLRAHTRAVLADVRLGLDALPDGDPRRSLTRTALTAAVRALSAPVVGTEDCTRFQAHTLCATYAHLDLLTTEHPAARRTRTTPPE